MLCNCKRLPEIDEFRCTYEITYGVPIEQPMYQCKDCLIVGNLYLCQNFAIKCHFGHNLMYAGILKNKICHCFDQCVCKISSKSRKLTCILVGSKGCCLHVQIIVTEIMQLNFLILPIGFIAIANVVCCMKMRIRLVSI